MRCLDASDGHRDHTTWAGAQKAMQMGRISAPARIAQRRRPPEAKSSRLPKSDRALMQGTRSRSGLAPWTKTPPADAAASTASRPAYRDDREPPLPVEAGYTDYNPIRNIVKAPG